MHRFGGDANLSCFINSVKKISKYKFYDKFCRAYDKSLKLDLHSKFTQYLKLYQLFFESCLEENI